jgi:hypothetical protein
VGAAPTFIDSRSSSEALADLRQHLLVRHGVLPGELGGHLLPGLLGPYLAEPHLERPLGGRPPLLALLGRDTRLDGGLQLLVDAGDGEEPRRPHLGQVGHDLPGVRTAGGGEAEHHRPVVAARPLGDVGHRQPGHDPAVVREGDQFVEALHRGHLVSMRELDALGRTGGAGGVDQSKDVVGLHGAPRGLEVELRIALGLDVRDRQRVVEVVGVDHDHVVHAVQGRDTLEECLLGDDDAGAGVPHLVLDLLGRVGVVDRERRGAEVHGGRVEEVELRAVGEHDRERMPAPEPERGEPGGHRLHLVGVLAPRHRERVLLEAQRAAVRVRCGGDLEGLGEGGGVEAGRTLGAALGRDAHGDLPPGGVRWSLPGASGQPSANLKALSR